MLHNSISFDKIANLKKAVKPATSYSTGQFNLKASCSFSNNLGFPSLLSPDQPDIISSSDFNDLSSGHIILHSA